MILPGSSEIAIMAMPDDRSTARVSRNAIVLPQRLGIVTLIRLGLRTEPRLVSVFALGRWDCAAKFV